MRFSRRVTRLFSYLTLAVFLFVVMLAVEARGHTPAELKDWIQTWTAEADTALSPALIAEWEDMVSRHSYYFNPQPDPPPRAVRGVGGDVEQWRHLVAAYFPANQVDRALCIMAHESGGNPDAQNPRSSAAGLFQIMGFWWDTYGGDRYDPETNVAVARRVYNQQGWNAWNPYKRGLCH